MDLSATATKNSGSGSASQGISAYDEIAARLADIAAKQLFFVCGSMKSGTTWLQIMLDAHPSASCGGEGHLADRLAPALQTAVNEYNEHIEWKNAQEIGDLAGFPCFGEAELAYTLRTAILLLLARQVADKPVAAIGEKTPDNILGMPFLHLMFPEAKFIVMVRDGRDCAVSGWFHNQRLSADWLESTYPTLDAYAAVTASGWAKEQEAAVRFAQQRPDHCLFLRYEDMVADTEACLRRVLGFLGLDSAAGIVADCCAKAAFTTLAKGRSPGQEDVASFFRKGVAGDWRNHLSAEANAAFIKEAGPWLTHFGYLQPAS